MRLVFSSVVVLAAGLLVGCQPNVIGTTPDAGDVVVVDAGSATDAGVRDTYPAGPYGVTVNQRIQNFTLPGYLSTQQTALTNTFPFDAQFNLQKIRAAKDANGKPYKYLLMAISAVWCAPCNQEAESLGNNGQDHALQAEWAAKGGLFMTVLIEGAQHGVAPTRAELESWINRHAVTNTIAMDDTQQLSLAGIDPFSIPANLVIDLDTMKMVSGWPGIDSAYAKWEATLAK